MRLEFHAMRPVPYFYDTFPKSRRPEYSRQKGEIQTQVVIVGGGLTGCACAASFAAAGVDVVLLEADRIGAGSSAASSGLVRGDFDASFEATSRAHGVRHRASAMLRPCRVQSPLTNPNR